MSTPSQHPATGAAVHTITAHAGETRGICFSPDGKRIATAGTDKLVCVWDVESGKRLVACEGHENEALLAGFVIRCRNRSARVLRDARIIEHVSAAVDSDESQSHTDSYAAGYLQQVRPRATGWLRSLGLHTVCRGRQRSNEQ